MKPTAKSLALCSAGLLIGMAACNGNSRNAYNLSDISDATIADSIMYYSGQMRAAEYWDDALDDDTLAFPKSRELFLEGVEDGIRTSKEDKIYNKGFKTGQRIAENCKRFSLRYGMDFNAGIVFRSLRSGLRSDTVVDIASARKEFYAMVNSCEAVHSEKVFKAAAKTLRREVKSLGMEQISDYIYGKTEHEGTGTKLKVGDPVRMVSDIRTMDGEKINFATMDNFSIGNRYMNEYIATALLTMSPGEIKKFAMPAVVVIGENCLEYDLKPSETLIVTLSVFSDHDKQEIK